MELQFPGLSCAFHDATAGRIAPVLARFRVQKLLVESQQFFRQSLAITFAFPFHLFNAPASL